MKSPRPVSTPFWLTRGEVTSAPVTPPPLAGQLRSVAQQQMLLGQQGLQLLDDKNAKEQDPSVLAGILKFLKYTPDQIKRIEKFVGTIEKIAGTVSWVVGAISSVTDLLKFLNVLDEDDAAAKLQQQIAVTVQTIYSYLEETEKKSEYALADQWRSTVQSTKTNIHNLALSRTQSNLDELWQSGHDMMEQAIRPMLGLVMGDIPFKRATYGGRPSPATYENEMPTHWTEYAFSLWMQTTGGAPVNNASFLDLGSRIWDPGYYLDVLIEAIGVRIAGLTALEPAFRSTALDRPDLREIASGLTTFIDNWERSLLITNIVGPLDPTPGLYGDHRIHHPWAGYTPLDMPGLPIGAIDPISGVAAFDPLWRDGFDMYFVSETGPTSGPETGYWALRNYDQVVSAAYAYRGKLLNMVREQCGINQLRTLRDSVAALVGPPSGSEFVIVSDPTLAKVDITGAALNLEWSAQADEEVDLGIIGQFAGKPGKKYAARRWYRYSTKHFRIPMPRRMDYSKTQLGYRLRFIVGHSSDFVGGDPPINVSSVLTQFSAQAFPEEGHPLFPTDPIQIDLQSDAAGVYDVLQSAAFSAHEEDVFESKGSVAKKQRLFLNRRDGKVAAQVKIEFEFDVHNPDSPFVGFANVTVGTRDPAACPDGFILDVEIYETVIPASDNPQGEERPVDLVRLHFVPSYLLVEPSYFTDREAGLKAMGQAMESVSEHYARSRLAIGPRDPIEIVSRVAQEQERIVGSYAELLQHAPDEARQLQNQFAVPALQPG